MEMAINPNKAQVSILQRLMAVLAPLILLVFFLPSSAAVADQTVDFEKPPSGYPALLYGQGDFYRVISEIKRLRFSDPEMRYDHSVNLMLLGSYLNLGQTGQLRTEATKLLNDPNFQEPSTEKLEIAGVLSASLLQLEKEKESQAIWRQYCEPTTCDTFPDSRNVEGLLDPHQAKLYSSILPGSGMLMSGDYGKAAISLLLNLGFLYHGVNFAMDGKPGIAGVLLFFEIGWYKGGKNATVESITLYNQRLIRKHQAVWINSKLNVLSP